MLEFTNIRLELDDLLTTEEGNLSDILCTRITRQLHLPPHYLKHAHLVKRSVDARKKKDVHFLASCSVRLSVPEDTIIEQVHERYVRKTVVPNIKIEPYQGPEPVLQPVVVGGGCAGLFATYTLAAAGLKPILIERGSEVTKRIQDIKTFNLTGNLNPESNVQFGAGGAGTFSDGKLNTSTRSPLHAIVLQVLVEMGAPRDILIQAKPHIGSDYLERVVAHLTNHLKELGAELYFDTCLEELVCDSRGHITAVKARSYRDDKTEHLTIPATHVILATGHSARGVFEHLNELNVALERKTFSMGFRIEHRQHMINKSQYGDFANHPALWSAEYKLVQHLPSKRSAYSFCMCPGGEVVAATSEINGVCTNGMSLYARDQVNANAGLLVNVEPTDLDDDCVLAGMLLQRRCEQEAFALGEGAYKAPAQTVGDFLRGVASQSAGSVVPSYSRGVTWTNLEHSLPEHIIVSIRQALPLLGKKLKGFDRADAVLTGVETRSSSPLRIVRDRETCESLSHKGLYPCGEGAGYAGGIMSAATDGIRCAQAVMTSLRDNKS